MVRRTVVHAESHSARGMQHIRLQQALPLFLLLSLPLGCSCSFILLFLILLIERWRSTILSQTLHLQERVSHLRMTIGWETRGGTASRQLRNGLVGQCVWHLLPGKTPSS